MFKLIFATFSLLILASPVHAGTIKGEVTYSGKVPAPVTHKTGKFKKVCGPEIRDESLILENQKVKNAVVWLEGKQTKKFKSKPGIYTIDQKKCAYSPHVLAMPQGSELKILTSDPINHNIHTYSFENDPINIMFLPNQDYTQEMEEPEVVKVSCDLHSWMVAYIVVTPHSYFSMTQSNGALKSKTCRRENTHSKCGTNHWVKNPGKLKLERMLPAKTLIFRNWRVKYLKNRKWYHS